MFLLASDFDRTFYINNYDFKCNLKLLPEFMKSNVFAIVTGRSYDDYMNVTKNCIPVNYLIINHGYFLSMIFFIWNKMCIFVLLMK